jgi:hypothetical protein
VLVQAGAAAPHQSEPAAGHAARFESRWEDEHAKPN